MVTSEVIRRTFQLKCGTEVGTCFTIDVDGKQYVCTAKHILNGFNSSTVELFHDHQWKPLKVKLVGYGSDDTDICVLAPEIHLSNELPLEATTGGLSYGQEVFFLGFPYLMRMESGNLNRQYPFPFVKRATVSAFYSKGYPASIIYLDGHNNPGFSGGPVVFSRDKRGLQGPWSVAGIVSGYKSDRVPVLGRDGEDTGQLVHANTGIVYARSIQHALDAIRQNPIGLSLD